MQKASRASARRQESEEQLLDKKRKRQTTDGTSATKQQTISELFSSGQPKAPHITKPIDSSELALQTKLATSPNTKRQKLDQPSSPFSDSLPAESMYNFPTRQRPSSSSVIDLTDSRDGTPSPRKSVRATPRANFNPNLGVKKIVVKNFRTNSRPDPREYLNQTWEKLNTALDAIFRGEKIPYSLEELYRRVENVCRQGFADELCGKLEEKAKASATNSMKAKLLEKAQADNIEVLQDVIMAWETWNAQMESVRAIFLYMNQAYLLRNKKASIQDIGVGLFRTVIFEDKQLQRKIIDGMCDLIMSDRAGQASDQELCKMSISMFHGLAVYTNVIEPRLLHLAQNYIKQWGEDAVMEMSLADYVNSCVALMDRELKRCEVLGLGLSTRRDVLALLEHQLIQRHQDKLLDGGAIANLLDQNAVKDLKHLYTLLQRIQLEEKIGKPFADWVEATGTDIIFNEKAQDSMVVRLLTLKRQSDNIWRESFQRNSEISYLQHGAFRTCMNKKLKKTGNADNNRPSEMIAKHIDMILRGGSKAIPEALIKKTLKVDAAEEEEDNEVVDEDAEVNKQLDHVLDLFRFVEGKDTFEAFYKKDLARRLLMGRSASADAERNVLTRLNTECGASLTQHWEQMFKDVELSREEMLSYNSLLAELGRSREVDLTVTILAKSAWPSYPDVAVNIPMNVKNEIDKFEQHYKSKHNGRRLEWKHALAHCQMRANFPKGRKELIVSSFQGIVLLLFNGVKEDEKIPYERLLAETGLPEVELNRTLQSLACAKLRPLKKHPAGRDINPTDSFSLNTSFDHERTRIKINQVQLKETKEENKETHERVQADRNFETQAAIVRIMKSKKKIHHQLLITEVIDATKRRGQLSLPDIKKNIDRLIDKEYMEREDGNMYSYIA